MKKEIKVLRVLCLILMFCAISTYSIGQIKFKGVTLRLFQAIAFNTTYENVIPSLKAAKFNLDSSEIKKDKTELLTFKAANQDIQVLYSEKKKLIYIKLLTANMLLIGPNTAKELRENDFINFNYVPGLSRILELGLKKEGYPYQFTIWQIGYFKETIYLFNPEFGVLENFQDRDKETELYDKELKD
ncbi:MAG TPA: hypothetical protein VK622_13235 [Puia sp.]|nr:hypothetical protein [Puia sp.]